MDPLPPAVQQRYVAVIDLPGVKRLFCSDQYRDEWTFRFGYAETFRELHQASKIAAAHGGRAALWEEAAAYDHI